MEIKKKSTELSTEEKTKAHSMAMASLIEVFAKDYLNTHKKRLFFNKDRNQVIELLNATKSFLNPTEQKQAIKKDITDDDIRNFMDKYEIFTKSSTFKSIKNSTSIEEIQKQYDILKLQPTLNKKQLS